jgi:hypothetical protein
MRPASMSWLFASLMFASACWTPVAAGETLAGSGSRSGASANAGTLYDAGTSALARGDLGPAVTLLKAAARLDPRARDIRTNLALARKTAAARRSDVEQATDAPGPPLSLSDTELWWIAASLPCGAAIFGALGLRRRSKAWLIAVPAGLVALSLAIGIFEGARAIEEARHPEAVVVVPILAASPAPEERPRPPYLLGTGEEVRIGKAKGALVEVWVGGNPIGWASRSGLWRVIDAPRYTAGADSATEQSGG